MGQIGQQPSTGLTPNAASPQSGQLRPTTATAPPVTTSPRTSVSPSSTVSPTTGVRTTVSPVSGASGQKPVNPVGIAAANRPTGEKPSKLTRGPTSLIGSLSQGLPLVPVEGKNGMIAHQLHQYAFSSNANI